MESGLRLAKVGDFNRLLGKALLRGFGWYFQRGFGWRLARRFLWAFRRALRRRLSEDLLGDYDRLLRALLFRFG
jgi:hypothetical protein